ncbi:MAG: riboflavin biosynthesis protein RibF [Trueperaceae bacterium]|nr:riboflavin biosynthesis protein RibF [Trueperaceae bacterium]
MEVYQSLDGLGPHLAGGYVVCIGNFDGVHRGHQTLLRRMQDSAEQNGNRGVVVTFQPPAKVLFRGTKYLSSEAEKLMLLRGFGPHAVVVIPFDFDYAKTDKQHFVAALGRLEPRHIIVGEDFRFGHQRRGTLNDLSQITPRLEVIGLQTWQGEPIKSSQIRTLLDAGDVAGARELLGYSYFASGRVVAGERRGRTIGFPTANLDLPEQKALPVGVFAAWVTTSEGRYGAMANVGPRPSFPEAPPSLEVHLFDFDADLYGQVLTVSFERRLRGQITFGGLEHLKTQLAEDRRAARDVLAAHS